MPLFTQSSSQIHWLAVVFELKISTIAAFELLSRQDDALKTLKPSKMNRLQRSMISGRVSTVANDSTVLVSSFLSNTISVLRKFLDEHMEEDDWKVN